MHAKSHTRIHFSIVYCKQLNWKSRICFIYLFAETIKEPFLNDLLLQSNENDKYIYASTLTNDIPLYLSFSCRNIYITQLTISKQLTEKQKKPNNGKEIANMNCVYV